MFAFVDFDEMVDHHCLNFLFIIDIFLLQGLGPGTGDMGIPDELHPENLNRLWNRFSFAQQERDSMVQSEVVRLVNVKSGIKGKRDSHH